MLVAAGPELLDRFIEACSTRGLAPKTLELWRCYARDFLRWVGTGRDLGTVREEDVRAYREKLGRCGFARHTQRQRLWVVISLFDWLFASRLIAANPASGIRRRTFFKRIPTESEMSRLLAASNRRTVVGRRDRAIAELMYSGGVSSEEVCRLDCADLDLASGTARCRYRGHVRVLLAGSAACCALQDYLQCPRPPEAAALFLATDGRRLTVYGIRTILRRLARKAGIESVTPQQIRQACATHLLQAGAELRDVQELLRHVHSDATKKMLRLYHPRERLRGALPARGEDELRHDSVLDSYIEASARRGLAPHTLDQQRWYARQFLEWVGDRDLGGLTGEEVSAYADELRARGLALESQEQRLWIVRDLFAWLFSRALIAANPVSGKDPFPERIPNESEMNRILAVPNPRTSIGRRDRAILELMYSAGLRGEEVGKLDCADVDLATGTVRVRYRGHVRIAPVGETACAALQDYLDRSRPGFVQRPEETALFLTSDQRARAGTRLTTHALKGILKRLARKAGIDHPVSPRQFRYACATHLLNAGADRRHVQQLLGHVPIDTIEMKKLHRQYHPRASFR